MQKIDNKTQAIFNMIGPCVSRLNFEVSQLHYSHWLSQKNHHHVVIGELYEDLQEELDALVEGYLGTYAGKYNIEDVLGYPIISKESFVFKPIRNEKQFLNYLDSLAERVQKGLDFIEKYPELKFMNDSLMDIIAMILSAKYQISQQ